ncbi:alpha/beta hydrolase [Phanerochaete sordida]|uniref:Alpha/beta hydrolase n=1 Tax=Phanerochaete sordida TaxID=48140 RepID=A0A9P3LE80_9APHY|nr:alpha/beta hydrolase [Phanerochaete sordida]
MTSMHEFVEEWLPGYDGTQFYTRTYAATFPKAVVLFMHGFAEHVGRYEHAHVQYPARHITLFAFDVRGYGRTALDTEHKSRDMAYSKTSWDAQLRDIEFFGHHLAQTYPGTPLYLMGHSAGGAAVLTYFTRSSAPPSPEGTRLFKAVIASSPCITLTHPKPRIVRWAGSKLALLRPWQLIPADVGIENITRNQASRDAYAKDPLIKKTGSLRALDDMLTGGEKLLTDDYAKWPKDLPLLIVHGTADQVTSCDASKQFFEKVPALDKKISLYEGGYHELVQEPDGIPDRLVNECISWIETHLPAKSPSAPGTPAEAKL